MGLNAIKNLSRDTIEEITVTIAAGQSSGTSSVDTSPEATIIGVVPYSANAADQHVNKAEILTTGQAKITLAGSSTNEVKYKVLVVK